MIHILLRTTPSISLPCLFGNTLFCCGNCNRVNYHVIVISYTKFSQGNQINRVGYIPFTFNRLTRKYFSCLGQTHSKLYTPFLGKEMSKTIPYSNLVPRVLSHPFLRSEREPGNEVTPSSDTSPYRPKKGVPLPRMNGLHTVVRTKFLSIKQFLFHDVS